MSQIYKCIKNILTDTESGSAVKSVQCSCGRLKFSSQNSNLGSSQLLTTLALEELNTSQASTGI